MPIKSVILIDSRVSNYQSLIDSLTEPSDVFVLDEESDGLSQIAAYLQGRSGIDAIHVISHGSQGALYLGSTMLNSGNLPLYQSQLSTIGNALTETGDILLYGCNVAQGQSGLQFINTFAQLTRADVAASDDVTGAAALGGDWLLERNTGAIHSTVFSSEKFSANLADTTPPTLTSLSIPTSVNVSNGTAGLTIAGTATDDLTGVKQVVVWFDKGLSYSFQLGSTSFSTYSFLVNAGIYDSWSDGASTQTYGISSFNASGVYNVTSVEVQDVQGNTRTYSPSQLTALGINTKLTLTGGTADTTPPGIRFEQGIENGQFVVNLFSTVLGTESSNIALDFTYASSGLSFSKISFGGNSAVSSSSSSANGNGTASISGQFAPNGTTGLPFATLTFVGSGSGAFNIDFSRLTLNSVSQTYTDPPATTYDLKPVVVLDTTPPTVTTFSPVDESVGVAVASNIVLTFNEPIQLGSGSIVLKTSAGVVVATYDSASSANLSISGSSLTINPSADLTNSTAYAVEFSAGSIKDLAGNNFAGTTSYNFTTASNPADQTFTGTAANESFTGGTGNDNIDGLLGVDTAHYSGKITDYFIKYNRALGTTTITDKRVNGDGTDTLKSIEKLQFADKTFDLLNPARTESAAFGKSQSFLFDPAYYLLKHPDLVPTVNLATAFDSYKTTAAQGAAPNAWFDPVYYANRWADLKPLNLDAVTLFAHYNLFGVWEGRSAGPSFDKYDGTRYLKDNPDVAAYVDAYVADFLGNRSNGAIAHYVIYGAAEGRVAYDTAGVAIDQAILIGVPG